MKEKAKATKADTPRRWRPLSQAQLNAVDLLLSGMNDTETAAHPSVNTCRQTIWDWKFHDPLFIAELQGRRASLWSSAHEKLRGLLAKAIENITTSIESGNVADSWSLLRCIGLYGNGTGNVVSGAHLEDELERLAEERSTQEYETMDSTARVMADLDDWQEHRKQQIFAELLEEYSDH